MCTVSVSQCGMTGRARMLGPALTEVRLLSKTGGQRAVSVSALHSIKRNLFGTTPADMTVAVAHADCELRMDAANKRWGFDFKANRPLAGQRFLWKPATRTLRKRADDDRRSPIAKKVLTQSLITDYLQPRKRPANDDCPSPAKLARLTSKESSSTPNISVPISTITDAPTA